MKMLVLTLSLTVATSAWAQTKTKRSMIRVPTVESASTMKASSVAKRPNWYQSRLQVGGLISTATDLQDVQAKNGAGTKIGGGDFVSGSSMGVTAVYMADLDVSFAWYTGLTFYNQKNIEKYSGSLNGVNGSFEANNDPTYQPMILTGGIAFKFNDQLYMPIGLNTTIVNFMQKGGFSKFEMTPALGLQFGLGAKLNPNFTAEINYQTVNYALDAEYRNVKFGGDVRMAGFLVGGRYIF